MNEETSEKTAKCPNCEFSEPYEPDEFGLSFFQAIGTCPYCDTPTVDELGQPTKVYISIHVNKP